MTREELLDILVKERTQDILEESLRNNEIYQTAMEEHDKACERLEMAGLNEEQREAVDEVLSTISRCMAIYGSAGYRQGLDDGIDLVVEILKVPSTELNDNILMLKKDE